MASMQDRVVLVTGAGQGLGAAICKALGKDGAKVVLADIRTDGLKKTAAELNDLGCNASTKQMDVTDRIAVEKILSEIADEHGQIDVIVNNAGVDYTKPVEEIEYEEWDKVIDVNLRGPFIVSKAALPYLKKSANGHIVNIASTACKRTWANASAYHASKWGLLGFSHALHVEAREQNIKVTAVIAGGMRTPFIMDRFPDTDPNVLQPPENVADTVKYVLSLPRETVIPEVMVIPMTETSWP